MRFPAVVAVSFLFGLLMCGCGTRTEGGQTVGTANFIGADLPELDELDSTRASAWIEGQFIPVTLPTWEQYTNVDGSYLHFAPPAGELGYAIYRVEPPWGKLLSIHATGSDTLWLAVADFGAERWVFMEFLADETVDFDLTQLEYPLSPSGYLYTAVVCGGGDEGWLYSQSLMYDNLNEYLSDWGLTATADDSSITLDWNELPVDGYIVLRSVVAEDDAPYEVGSVEEEALGGNSFSEVVPEGSAGRWVPENRDNGTPADSSDDFPALAPAVDYHYRLIPLLYGKRGPQSPEVSAMVAWGERRVTQRSWPDTTNQTGLIGCFIDGSRLTPAQFQWCAEHLVGAFGLLQSELDAIRQYNPDFIGLNSQTPFFASPIYQNLDNYRLDPDDSWPESTPLYYGDEEDSDGAYPYVDRHESWFLHDPAQLLVENRVENELGLGCWLDLSSGVPGYLSAAATELLGEDCFDGWVLDAITARHSGQYPAGVSTQGELLAFLRPGVDSLLSTFQQRFSAHPLAPDLVADVYIGSNLDYRPYDGSDLFDLSACDVVWVSDYLYSPFGSVIVEPFENETGPNILSWQGAGKKVILTGRIDNLFGTQPKNLVPFCSYLLLRNEATYYYAYPVYVTDPSQPLYFGEYAFDPGAPLDPAPTTIDDLRTTTDYMPTTYWYQRDFANCSVLVVPEGLTAAADPNDGIYYEYLDCGRPCYVDESGNAEVTLTWHDASRFPGFSLETGAWIIRERAEP